MESRKWVIHLTIPIVTADGETVEQITLKSPNPYDKQLFNGDLDKLTPFGRILKIVRDLADVDREIVDRICIPDYEQVVSVVTELSEAASKQFDRRYFKKMKKRRRKK